MSYVSFRFLLFVAGTVLAYFLYPVVFRKWRDHQWLVLLAASWLFYWICGGGYLVLIVWTSFAVYLGARLLQRLSDEQKRALDALKKANSSERKETEAEPCATDGGTAAKERPAADG